MGLITSGPKENKSLGFFVVCFVIYFTVESTWRPGSRFGHPVHSSPNKPKGFGADTWWPRGGLSLPKRRSLEGAAAQLETPSQEGSALESADPAWRMLTDGKCVLRNPKK